MLLFVFEDGSTKVADREPTEDELESVGAGILDIFQSKGTAIYQIDEDGELLDVEQVD